jgi:hypothetical protein
LSQNQYDPNEATYRWNGRDFELIPPPAGPGPRTGFNPEDPGEDPRKLALDLANKSMANGARWEDAAGQFIRQLASAANNGDPRVIARSYGFTLVETDEHGDPVGPAAINPEGGLGV